MAVLIPLTWTIGPCTGGNNGAPGDEARRGWRL